MGFQIRYDLELWVLLLLSVNPFRILQVLVQVPVLDRTFTRPHGRTGLLRQTVASGRFIHELTLVNTQAVWTCPACAWQLGACNSINPFATACSTPVWHCWRILNLAVTTRTHARSELNDPLFRFQLWYSPGFSFHEVSRFQGFWAVCKARSTRVLGISPFSFLL